MKEGRERGRGPSPGALTLGEPLRRCGGQLPPSHRNGFSSRSGVPHGLFYDQATRWLDLQNAHAPGSLRSPYGCLRTETPLRDIPVFRSAYFPIPHRPTFGAPVFRSAYSASRNARASAASRPPSSHTVLSYSKRTCFRFAALTLRVQGSRRATPQALRGDEKVFQEQDR